jgi:hypothetical protein
MAKSITSCRLQVQHQEKVHFLHKKVLRFTPPGLLVVHNTLGTAVNLKVGLCALLYRQHCWWCIITRAHSPRCAKITKLLEGEIAYDDGVDHRYAIIISDLALKQIRVLVK